MWSSFPKRILLLSAVLLGAWLGLRYLLPVLLPFLLGITLALAAEPLVAFGSKRLGLPRSVSAGIGVSVTLVFMLGLICLIGAVAVRQLGRLAAGLPDPAGTADQGIALLRDWLVGVTERTPEPLRPVLTRSVVNFFRDGTAMMEQMSQKLPGLLSSALSWIPAGALGLGTCVLSGFMFSARLPRLRGIWEWEPLRKAGEQYLPVLRRIRGSLGAWLRAQLKLLLVCWSIAGMGLMLLGIPRGILWAGVIALVDAVPLLGSGAVLAPWALVSFLQGQKLRALGLLLTWAAALVTRTVLEPRFVGKHLGLDPLLTLLALYMGCRFWGLPGMILAPLLASAVKTAFFPAPSGE